MNQLINLADINNKALLSSEQVVKAASENKSDSYLGSELYQKTLEVLAKNNPQKITFSIKEAADQLGVGEEFIRRRTKSGVIKVTYFGDKPMIHITELTRISLEGV